MTYRLSISVPDELHKRIKQYKGELNVSKICQKALISATDRIEKKDEAAQHTGNVIERLRKEHIEQNKDEIEDEAYNDAQVAADNISYKTFMEFRVNPYDFWDADPKALHELYGEPKQDTHTDFFNSFFLQSMYYKRWAICFCERLDDIRKEFDDSA